MSIPCSKAPSARLRPRSITSIIAASTIISARHNAYASWEAKRHADLMARGDAAWAALTPRQRTKYRNLSRWWFAPAYFAGTYFLKLGFLDGAAGFHYAFLKLLYFYEIRLKIIGARD